MGTKDTIYEGLFNYGITRRDFMKFCTTMSATLALSSTSIPKIAEALQQKKKPYAVWLHFQECTGDTESLLRATKPSIAQIVLDIISLEYHETIMAGSGHSAEKALHDVVKNQKGKYFALVEGSIPTKDGGIYCVIAGKTAVEIAKEVCGNALVTINVGSCSCWGGIGSAKPNPTGATGTASVVPGIKYINLPGCPANAENITATIVHYLTFGTLPALDRYNRPLFAYGKRIHDNCERRPHFDAGQFVRKWGDEGHRLGWCLYEMGCKGPMAYQNCPTVKWNDGISYPIQSGHPCFACASNDSWDVFGPIYNRAPHVPGASYQATADKIGAAVVAGTAAAVATHAVIRTFLGYKQKERFSKEKNEADKMK
ncbi:MAG: hydrogenase small subunit [Thermodesulfovibrionales bacterium]|nr:hydrogenase small subunit [Thermodesulfovibrionales bacterium]